MAKVRIPDEERTITDAEQITRFLSTIDIEYERWEPKHTVADDAPAEVILEAYRAEIDALKRKGGYVTADVIDIVATTPNLDAMLNKFAREHWHNEDEVRFIIKGSGLFHIHRDGNPVVAIEVEAGDLIRVPRGTWHWFDLCPEREIRAIRLFQDVAGWTPHYTDSGVDGGYEAICLGPAYVRARS